MFFRRKKGTRKNQKPKTKWILENKYKKWRERKPVHTKNEYQKNEKQIGARKHSCSFSLFFEPQAALFRIFRRSTLAEANLCFHVLVKAKIFFFRKAQLVEVNICFHEKQICFSHGSTYLFSLAQGYASHGPPPNLIFRKMCWYGWCLVYVKER